MRLLIIICLLFTGCSTTIDQLIERSTDYTVFEKLESVNDTVNRGRYVDDWINWRVEDYWESPEEFWANGGDCEDFAIAKYCALRRMGIPKEDMHVLIARVKWGENHGVLIYNNKNLALDNKNLVLDNRTRWIKPFHETDLTELEVIDAERLCSRLEDQTMQPEVVSETDQQQHK